jgi:hypothetical protein
MIDVYNRKAVNEYDDKVAPHISEQYDWAGLNREEYIAGNKKFLEEEEKIKKIELTELNIDIQGDKATARITLNVLGEIEPEEDGLPFKIVIGGLVERESEFIKEDEKWKVIKDKSAGGVMFGDGGDKDFIPDLRGINITPTESIKPGGRVKAEGEVKLPQGMGRLPAGHFMAGKFSLSSSERVGPPGYSVFTRIEFIEVDYTVNKILPEPGQDSIPKVFNKGVDSLEAVFSLAIVQIGFPLTIKGVSVIWLEIPLEDFSNES